MCKSKLSEKAIRKFPLRSAHLQMAHYWGKRDSDSADSDVDYESECGVHSAYLKLDESVQFSDFDLTQTISSLEFQLADLKTCVEMYATQFCENGCATCLFCLWKAVSYENR